MAADHSEKAVNGNHGTQSYGQAEAHQPSNTAVGHTMTGSFGEEPSATHSSSTVVPPEDQKPIPKDMIGWYFVEQYYNTMSKNPEKLYLYYTKLSQFVSGNEAEKVPVAVGQRAIGERIKELDIQECKVRVSNVDSQESFKNILVQVIGEMSNNAAPHRKFVQTFVLAEQPTGYYVLNDVFRYILEDDEEELENGDAANTEFAPQSGSDPLPATLTSSSDPAQQQHDATQVDRLLQEEDLKPSFKKPSSDVADVSKSGITAQTEIVVADDAPVAGVKEPEESADPLVKDSSVAGGTVEAEKPRDPEPTPVASPPKASRASPVEAQTPSAPPKPAAPKTWANLVAANRATAPVVPNGTAAHAASATAPSKAKPTSSPTKESSIPSASNGDEGVTKPQPNGNAGWQMAGSDNNKRQGRRHSQSMSSNKDAREGYLRNVTEKVDASILKAQLAAFGKLGYFDVNRQKNCAFVDFVESTAYLAAVAANPLSIGGEQIFIEERRPRAGAFGGNLGGRGGMRGNRGNAENRPGSQGRGGFSKDGGRGGNYAARGGRGGTTPRGRGGQPQAA